MRWLIKSTICLLLASCSAGIAPINYGQDACDFCRMTIMDPKFGGEIITVKGKAYKFDSEECMVAYYKAHQEEAKDFSMLAVADFTNPGKLLDVRRVVFLKDEQIHSPMGGHTAAFPDRQAAGKTGTGSGQLLEWNELLKEAE